MTLDPQRWDNYLDEPLLPRLIELTHQLTLIRSALSTAEIELYRQQDEWRQKVWEEPIAAQDRRIGLETRFQANTLLQLKSDLQELLDERTLLTLLLEHPDAPK